MLRTFRNLSNSLVGKTIAIIFLILIIAGFAAGDLQSFGGFGGGANSRTLADVGDESVDQRDFQTVAQRMLNNARAEQPDASYADIGSQLPLLIESLIDEKALSIFARENGVSPSKRMIDAQIAQLPGAKGADGRFSEQAYVAFLQQSRLSDADVRRVLRNQINQQLILGPAIADPRSSNKIAKAYASMLLEQRTGTAVILPVGAFAAGLEPTAGDLQGYYQRNKARYLIPEQRVLTIGEIDASLVNVAAPSEADVDTYYRDKIDTFGGGETRVVSQLVLGNEEAAAKVAAAAKGGKSLAEAAAAGGKTGRDVATVDLRQDQYAGAAGKVAADAVFAAAQGSVVGPLRADIGWVVATVDKVNASDKTQAEAKSDARKALMAERSVAKINELAGEFEDMIADGASLSEAAAAKGISLSKTEMVTAQGKSLDNPSYAVPAKYVSALGTGFQLERNEDPVIEANAAGDGYLIVGVDEIRAAAPPPLAEIRDQVRQAWINEQADGRAAAAASKLVAAVKGGKTLKDAVAQLGVSGIQTDPMSARRLDIPNANPDAIAPLRLLFSLPIQGTGLVRDPSGRGFVVVQVAGTKAGDALTNPGLVQQARQGYQQSMGRELGDALLAAVREEVGVKRNEAAITKTLSDLISTNE